MKRSRNFISALIGLLLLIALGIGLAAMLQGTPSNGGGPGVSPLATAVTLQSPLSTPTPVSTPSPVPTTTPVVIPPPPGWPTDQLWPPQITPVTPPPVPTPRPFPTPAFPEPVDQRPEQLQYLWFPHFPDSASVPQLRAVLVDRQGQRWAQSDRLLSLTLRKPQPGPDPGPVLVDMHVSPDHRWMVADFAYVGSQLVDMSSGAVQSLVADSPINNWHFWAWTPDSQHILISSDKGFLLLDLVSHEYESIDFPKDEMGFSPVRAIAYSPDGQQIADVLVHAPTVTKPTDEVEVGIRVGEQGERTSLFRLTGASMIANYSLRWSPDGHNMIVVADVHENDDRYTQLWIINVIDNTSRMLGRLAKGVQYNNPAVWSPDGRSIAAIKIESDDRFTNVYLIDPETGQEQQLTRFTDRQISHLTWSPDGQTLGFTVSGKDYGEIWVTNLDGTRQHPVAGPTTPNAPFMWLSGR